MVERFMISYDARGEVRHPKGDFVHWADFAALSAKLAEAERERAANHNLAVANGQRAKEEHYRAEAAEARVAELEKALMYADEMLSRTQPLIRAALAATKEPKPCPECAGTGYRDKGGARLAIQRTPCSRGCKEPKPCRRRTEEILNPGSKEARARGCQCPVIENHHGRGVGGGIRGEDGQLIFDVSGNCEMHRDWEPR
jgi:hypothetical protein